MWQAGNAAVNSRERMQRPVRQQPGCQQARRCRPPGRWGLVALPAPRRTAASVLHAHIRHPQQNLGIPAPVQCVVQRLIKLAVQVVPAGRWGQGRDRRGSARQGADSAITSTRSASLSLLRPCNSLPPSCSSLGVGDVELACAHQLAQLLQHGGELFAVLPHPAPHVEAAHLRGQETSECLMTPPPPPLHRRCTPPTLPQALHHPPPGCP